MLLPSHFQLEPSNSNSRTRVPAGGINLIASIDFGSDGATTATLSSSTKVSQGDDAISRAQVATPNHSNQQYSIYAITDSAANIVERYAYTAYGQPTILNAAATVIATSAISNRYTYTAREWDATVGLYHFRARWVSGLTGRFLSRDPKRFIDGYSLYSVYFAMKAVDPFGTDKKILTPQQCADKKKACDTAASDEYSECIKGESEEVCWGRLMVRVGRCATGYSERLKDWNKGPVKEVKDQPEDPKKKPKKKSKWCKIIDILDLADCEKECAEDYQKCLTKSNSRYESCLRDAYGMRPELRSDAIALCDQLSVLDFYECPAEYAACGLSCMLPF